MTDRTPATAYFCEGSVALNPQAPTLTLIEGGLSRRPTHAASRTSQLAPRQLAALLVLGSLVVALALLASWASDAVIAGAAPAAGSIESEVVTVMPGDTLWGLAEERDVPGMSTAAVVAWIEGENGLTGSFLAPGQRIVVPARVTT